MCTCSPRQYGAVRAPQQAPKEAAQLDSQALRHAALLSSSAWFMWWCAVCCVHASCVLHVTGSVGRDAAHASLRHTAAKERIAFVPSADLKYMPGLVEADEGVQQRPHVLHTHMHVVQRLHRCEERRIVDTPCPHARDDGGPLTHSFTPTSLRRTR